MRYVQAAASCADDDPERANYLCVALLHMTFSGHVSIQDIKGIYKLALASIAASKLLFGDEPTVMKPEGLKQAKKFIRKLDALVGSGNATLESRLRPSPDAHVDSDTVLGDINPTVFAPDEDEAGWITPDGKFRENNSIFEGDYVDGPRGWIPVKPSENLEERLSGLSVGSKKERKNGKDDWSGKSYMDTYSQARSEYEELERAAKKSFAEEMGDL